MFYVSKFGSEWQGVFGRGRDLQAARPYWFELIPADKMSYENNDENIDELHQHQPAIYPFNASFSTHEIQPRL
jgi:hypothetical protein